MNIKDKVVIITGASAGIGLETAKLLASKGAKVALAARSIDVLNSLSKNLPESFAVMTDMTDSSSIENMISEVQKHYGQIDILINNAGQGIYGALEHVDLEEYKKVINLNVIGPLQAMQLVIPIMRVQGGGMIVNISSMVSKNYYPYLGAYASTKYALNCLSMTARAELVKDNIQVALMHPTMTETDFGKNAVKSDDVARTMESRHRSDRPAPDTAEHVAERILLTIESEKAEVYAHDHLEIK